MLDLWLIFDRVTIVLALLSSGYSAYSWWRHKRREELLQKPIPIKLFSAEENTFIYELPYKLPRRLMTRAEVLGHLGMIPSSEAGKRFEWAHLHSVEFMNNLEAIYNAKQDILLIPITKSESAQLALPSNNKSLISP